MRIKRGIVPAWLLAGLLVAPIATNASEALPRQLRTALSDLPHPQTRVSACVIDLQSGREVFTLNADEPLIPASAMKVFTMAAALTELGPSFEFQTVLATDGRNLIVIGDGDPAIGDDRLARSRNEPITAIFEHWAQALRTHGLTSIDGDLIIDETIFDDVHIHPTWEAEDHGKWYAAPVGGLNINSNCLNITLQPAENPGAPVRVEMQPPNTTARIINRARTGPGTAILHHPPGTLEFRISGRTDKTWAFVPVAFPDPGLLFADSMRTILTREGISITGDTRRTRARKPDGAVPLGLPILTVHRTPIDDALARAGKDSQNLFAECLFKRTGFAWATRNQNPNSPEPHDSPAPNDSPEPQASACANAKNPTAPPNGRTDPAAQNHHGASEGRSQLRGSFDNGSLAVHDMLRRARINTEDFVVVDGSGLSRHNQCTANHLTRLLAWSHRQPWAASLKENLAVAGVDGSLHKRIRDMPNRVFAKTGTMRGVRTLAGYIDDGSGPRYTFAVMFNDYPGPSTPYRRVQDVFCRILAEAADGTP